MNFCTFIPQGRAGNFFFACATVYAYAKKHGLSFTVPFNTSSDKWSPIYLHHLQDGRYNPAHSHVRVLEKQFHYVPLEFKPEYRNKNIVFQGYFQAPQYFQEYRNEILEAFNLPYERKEGVCSIHARYGDYLTIEGKHIVLDESYLLRAMDYIKEKTGVTRFKVFSDDLNLFATRHGNLYDFEYSKNKSEIDDLVEISHCEHHINSSSTFSWWGAWLNQNPDKVVVTPVNWFQPGWDNADTKDIVPSNWIKL